MPENQYQKLNEFIKSHPLLAGSAGIFGGYKEDHSILKLFVGYVSDNQGGDGRVPTTLNSSGFLTYLKDGGTDEQTVQKIGNTFKDLRDRGELQDTPPANTLYKFALILDDLGFTDLKEDRIISVYNTALENMMGARPTEGKSGEEGGAAGAVTPDVAVPSKAQQPDTEAEETTENKETGEEPEEEPEEEPLDLNDFATGEREEAVSITGDETKPAPPPEVSAPALAVPTPPPQTSELTLTKSVLELPAIPGDENKITTPEPAKPVGKSITGDEQRPSPEVSAPALPVPPSPPQTGVKNEKNNIIPRNARGLASDNPMDSFDPNKIPDRGTININGRRIDTNTREGKIQAAKLNIRNAARIAALREQILKDTGKLPEDLTGNRERGEAEMDAEMKMGNWQMPDGIYEKYLVTDPTERTANTKMRVEPAQGATGGRKKIPSRKKRAAQQQQQQQQQQQLQQQQLQAAQNAFAMQQAAAQPPPAPAKKSKKLRKLAYSLLGGGTLSSALLSGGSAKAANFSLTGIVFEIIFK